MEREEGGSTCPTFLHHEASFMERKSGSRSKKRMSGRALMEGCIALMEKAPPKDCLPPLHPHDRVFLTQVLYGCCRYKGLLLILTSKLFYCKSPSIQIGNKILYTVLGYLVLIRLEELTFFNFRKLILSQHPQSVLPFVQFIFSKEDLITFCRPEWINLYDKKFIDELIDKVASWHSEALELSKRLEEKIFSRKHGKKRSTTIQPFNLTQPNIKPLMKEEEKLIPLKFKARPAPRWRGGLTSTQKALQEACEISRKRLAQFYSDPENQPFYLQILERPSNLEAIKEMVELERELQTRYIAPKARPCPDPPVSEVRLTTAAVLREHALYQKQQEEEQQRIKAFEMELRDDSDYKCWQEEMRLKLETADAMHRQFRKASIDASDQAAVDAKHAKARENREIAQSLKAEAQKLDFMKKKFILSMQIFNRLKCESVLECQQNVKESLAKVANTKKERAKEIQEETRQLADIAAKQRGFELAYKRELIQQLHALENESTHIIKKFDRSATGCHGLLSEMSIEMLQEQLEMMKKALKEEESSRRAKIHANKDENYNKLLTKSAFVSKMRQVSQIKRLAKKDDQKQSDNIAAVF